jgi:hypothetical protein
MVDLPFSSLAWDSLATMIQGRVRHRAAGWVLKPKIQVEGVYEGCRVRGSMVGVDAPARLEMDGRGGRGLTMKFRNALHAGGEALTDDVAFDNEVDWKVSHPGYARLWLARPVRRAVAQAEFWDLSFDAGSVRAKGRRGSFGPVLHAMTRLALRGDELGERWDAAAKELAGTWRGGPLSIGKDTAIQLIQGSVHITVTPTLNRSGDLNTVVHAKAPGGAELDPRDLSEGELAETGPGRATAKLQGFVDEPQRLRGLVDSMTRGLMPANPYR